MIVARFGVLPESSLSGIVKGVSLVAAIEINKRMNDSPLV